jgi:putative tricarboxylic transport membrane protein
MKLEKYIALILCLIFILYGYEAFFTMDELLPPILKRNPVWPSTFPKILAAFGFFISILILLNIEKNEVNTSENLDYKKVTNHSYFKVILLILGMVLYALNLRYLGFILSSFLFLSLSSFLLGERNFVKCLIIILISTISIWYLVNEVLGIYMNPYPLFLKVFI